MAATAATIGVAKGERDNFLNPKEKNNKKDLKEFKVQTVCVIMMTWLCNAGQCK